MAVDGTALLPQLLDASPFPVIVADPRGRILVFSRAAEAVLGYRPEEACEHVHVTDLYHRPEDARRVLERVRARPSTLPALHDPIEVTLRARSGELIPVRLTAVLARDATGAETASLGVFEDRREHISLGKRLEDATGQVVASEKRAAAIAVASTAAHELSQPLMAAMGNVELMLLGTELPPELAARLERTYEQLERMRRIVNDFSRFTATRSNPGVS